MSSKLRNSSNKKVTADQITQRMVQVAVPTVPTTGNADAYMMAPCAGVLLSAVFSEIEALAVDDTNYVTFGLTNLGQAGAGSTAMLAATDPNTTKATGGTAIGANTKRPLTVHGTAANKVVAQNDRLRFRVAVSGTLGAQKTGGVILLTFQQTF